jgi:hypothetical protein
LIDPQLGMTAIPRSGLKVPDTLIIPPSRKIVFTGLVKTWLRMRATPFGNSVSPPPPRPILLFPLRALNPNGLPIRTAIIPTNVRVAVLLPSRPLITSIPTVKLSHPSRNTMPRSPLLQPPHPLPSKIRRKGVLHHPNTTTSTAKGGANGLDQPTPLKFAQGGIRRKHISRIEFSIKDIPVYSYYLIASYSFCSGISGIFTCLNWEFGTCTLGTLVTSVVKAILDYFCGVSSQILWLSHVWRLGWMRMYLRHKGKQYFLIDLLVFGKNCSSSCTVTPYLAPWS